MLLHCFGHISQWHYNEKFIPLSDKLNTIDIKDINEKEHYEHEVDTMHYCVWLLNQIGESNLVLWLVQYFNADMLYMHEYFQKCSLPDERIFLSFFDSKPVGNDLRRLYAKEPNLTKDITFSKTPVYVI